MVKLTRRNFLKAGAVAAAASMLAACNGAAPAPAGDDAPADAGEVTYPIDPEELGSGTPKWTEEDVDKHKLVTQEGGATLSYSPESGLALIQVDGYVFKDLNGNGKLDLFEDWRQPAADRAADWAAQLEVADELPLMLHASAFAADGARSPRHLQGILRLRRSAPALGMTWGCMLPVSTVVNTAADFTWNPGCHAVCP